MRTRTSQAENGTLGDTRPHWVVMMNPSILITRNWANVTRFPIPGSLLTSSSRKTTFAQQARTVTKTAILAVRLQPVSGATVKSWESWWRSFGIFRGLICLTGDKFELISLTTFSMTSSKIWLHIWVGSQLWIFSILLEHCSNTPTSSSVSQSRLKDCKNSFIYSLPFKHLTT